MKRHNFRAKRVLRYDNIQGHLRLFRLMWERGEVGFGNGGYSVKLSVAVQPKLFAWERQSRPDWLITLCGIRIHYARSYGGIFA